MTIDTTLGAFGAFTFRQWSLGTGNEKKPTALRALVVLLISTLGVTTRLAAHEVSPEQQILLTVLTWANSRSGGDFERLAGVLHDRFKERKGPFETDKAAYLALKPGRTITPVA
ncbi:MAG: hypothetical protein L0Y58_14045 [Verrucomicrobia subdivision 3 bacterium]|nr:hypothetical protein [Limisphaerales bacterium]